jgi:hypothetical protein
VALAYARKGARKHVPDLMWLLDDLERPVAEAARTALRELKGEDGSSGGKGGGSNRSVGTFPLCTVAQAGLP